MTPLMPPETTPSLYVVASTGRFPCTMVARLALPIRPCALSTRIWVATELYLPSLKMPLSMPYTFVCWVTGFFG